MARRRKKIEEHENHERWLVSYADFITLLFAFFVVMYSLSSLNEGKYRVASESIKNAISPIKHDLSDIYLKKKRMIQKELNQKLLPLIKAKKVNVYENSDGIFIEMNTDFLFGKGNTDISEKSVQILKDISYILKDTKSLIQVQGHTDNIPINSIVFPSNWELSSGRAASVVKLLNDNGIIKERLSVLGYADTRPKFPNDSEENRMKNRRVTIFIKN